MKIVSSLALLFSGAAAQCGQYTGTSDPGCTIGPAPIFQRCCNGEQLYYCNQLFDNQQDCEATYYACSWNGVTNNCDGGISGDKYGSCHCNDGWTDPWSGCCVGM